MALFTFNLDFGGGNYTAQREGPDPVTALFRWFRRNPCPRGITKNEWRKLVKDFKYEEMVTLKRVKNVWCLCGSVGRKHAILNIIKTSEN